MAIESTSLGSFGGDSSAAYAIAGNGSVAGGGLTAIQEERALLHENETWQDLEGGFSRAHSLNSSRAVAGTSYAGGRAQAVVWSGNTRFALETLGGAESDAMGINSAGVVVGRADTAGGQGHAFRWNGGRMEDLGTLPGGSWASAYAINDGGQVVGYGMTGSGFFRAFVESPGLGLTELGTLGGWNSYAFGINGAGRIIGHSSIATGYLHAFLYSSGRMEDLGTLGGNQSYAYGINGGGGVVGHSLLAGSQTTHACLYRNGRMTDLNALIDPAGGWELLEAYGINESGQIAGRAWFDGRALACRLDPAPTATPPTPNPEPGTLVLPGIGLVAGAGSARRKKNVHRAPQDPIVALSARRSYSILGR